MHNSYLEIVKKLSSANVHERVDTILSIAESPQIAEAPLVRLSLLYVADHDPYLDLRELARRTALSAGANEINGASWEKTVFL